METTTTIMEKFEKLPKIVTKQDSNTSDCIIPYIDKNENAAKDIKFSNCLPDELIISLKQTEQPKEYLGPPSKKNPTGIKPLVPSIVKRPDNAWNYEKQREKFKFLTDQPICSCGAGKDISFIYDCAIHKPPSKVQPPSKFDLSAIRAGEIPKEQPSQIDNTLIPEEYRIVKNQGVWPLKVEESEFTIMPEDHLNHLTVFPSLKPTGRNEVIKLKHTMDSLLKRVGADIIEQKGPTQLHNLLEIIKKEQDIYNIVFHEVIRQVTVECKERGEILSKLRERYANLLSRVPREIKGLHEEVIAQRALDRKLTEELVQFKSTIQALTDELVLVKEHDRKLGEQANNYQKDLHAALAEAKSNASLLKEYHEVYELQRRRLEKTIETITEEREIWINSSYSIATKVIHENELNTSKNLNLAEKTWAKLARYFALVISDVDTADLIEIRKCIENWKENVEELKTDVVEIENEVKLALASAQAEYDTLRNILNNIFDSSGTLIRMPDAKRVNLIHGQIKKIHQIVNKQAELLTGEAAIMSEDRIKKGDSYLNTMLQMCSKLRLRHNPAKEQSKIDQLNKYEKIEKDVKLLHQQYKIRATGDNGLSTHLINLNNGLDLWRRNLYTQILIYEDETKANKPKMTDFEWIGFYQLVDEWKTLLAKSVKSVGSLVREQTHHDIAHLADTAIQPKEDISNNYNNADGESNNYVQASLAVIPVPESVQIIDHDIVANQLKQWLTTFIHFIESQNAFDIELIKIYHNEIIHWMIQSLIRLAPDRDDISDESLQMLYQSTKTIEELQSQVIELREKLSEFTESLASRVSPLASDEKLNLKENKSTEVENENLKNLKNSCKEWIKISKLIVDELNNRAKSSASYERSTSSSRRDTSKQRRASQDSFGTATENTSVLTKSNNLQPPESAITQTTRPVKSAKSVNFAEDKQDVKLVNYEQSTDHFSIIQPQTFEVITHDTNTERKFLENLNINGTSEHLDENELKTTVFNAFKTIEGLQKSLLETEERAQHSEAKVADLETKLKDAFEKIRLLENKLNENNKTSNNNDTK